MGTYETTTLAGLSYSQIILDVDLLCLVRSKWNFETVLHLADEDGNNLEWSDIILEDLISPGAVVSSVRKVQYSIPRSSYCPRSFMYQLAVLS